MVIKSKSIVGKILPAVAIFFYLNQIKIINRVIIMHIVITRCLPTEAKLHVVFMLPIREKFLHKCVSALRVITIIIIIKQNSM